MNTMGMALKAFRSLLTVMAVVVAFAIFPAVSAAATLTNPVYAAGQLSNTYFNIKYTSATEKTAANALFSYVGNAYAAAKGVIGYDNKEWLTKSNGTLYQAATITKINVEFYNDPQAWAAGLASGSASIRINLAKFLTSGTYDGKSMGAILAHETSHILFNTNTKTADWNRSSFWGLAWKTFTTEALAYYAMNVVYNKWTLPLIKQNLQSACQKAFGDKTAAMLWVEAGLAYSYVKDTDPLHNAAWWTFNAAGYFLAYGKSTKTKALVDALRSSAGLRSSDGTTAWNAFNQAFKTAYGKYIYHGSIVVLGNGTSWRKNWNTACLLGDYYQMSFK